MPAPAEPPVALVRVGTAGSRRRSWIATATAVLGFGALIAVGALGGGAEPAPDPERSPRTGIRASPGAATPGPDDSAETGPPASGPRVVSVARSGYVVTYDRDPSHRPIVLDGGALAIFGYGERVPNGAYPGTVHVAVGTPARSAPVSGDGDLPRVYGTTLDDLERDYLDAIPLRPISGRDGTLDGARALLLEFADDRWVALAAHGNRSYVITATGFAGLYPDAVQPARQGLETFIDDFRLLRALFVSRELGFQVPLPVGEWPFGATRGGPPLEADGLYVFPDGREIAPDTWSYSIGVSVGSKARPALVEVLPGGLAEPRPKRIWADSLVGLQSAFLEAIGGRRGSSTTIRVGGELALLVERPNGLAVAVLLVRHGRVYIISTTGSRVTEPAPGFEEFLEAFQFIDPS